MSTVVVLVSSESIVLPPQATVNEIENTKVRRVFFILCSDSYRGCLVSVIRDDTLLVRSSPLRLCF